MVSPSLSEGSWQLVSLGSFTLESSFTLGSSLGLQGCGWIPGVVDPFDYSDSIKPQGTGFGGSAKVRARAARGRG